MSIFNRQPKEQLFVITTIFNPKQFKSRFKLYKEFEKRMLDAGIVLIVIEATFKNNKPEVTEKMGKNHFIFHVKADCELWLKENLINIGIEKLTHLFPKWKYVAMVDADIAFARPDWVLETKILLQSHPIIQMFSYITQLDPNYQPMHGHNLGFMEGWGQGLAFKNKKPSGEDPTKIRYGWCGAPGGAWAATRKCIDKIFPLLDIGILGSGDFHMVTAMMGYVDLTFTMAYTDSYQRYLLEWQEKVKHLKDHVGYMKGLILHYWHGKIKDRGYETRWKLLVKHKFNPYKDLVKNKHGVYVIHSDKKGLIKDIEEHFLSRKEDDV